MKVSAERTARGRTLMGWRRWLAVLLAVALGGAQTASFVHQAVVQHVTCAEHGELVEVEVGAGAGPQRSTAATVAVDDRAPEGRGHDHHCPLVPTARDAASSQHQVIASARALPAPRVVIAPCSDAPPAPSIARYVVAPKNSPPA